MDFALLLSIIYAIINLPKLPNFDITFLIILVVIGLIIIILIKLILVLIPAILVAAAVYFISGGNLLWTGIAFLLVAAISILLKF